MHKYKMRNIWQGSSTYRKGFVVINWMSQQFDAAANMSNVILGRHQKMTKI